MAEPITSDQIFISKLTDIILENLGNENFGVKEFTLESGLSRTALNRKLRKILNKSINRFIHEVRLKKALEMLKNGSVTVSEVAYKVGFRSPAYFNTCFHEFFGYPPGKVKRGDSGNSDENSGAQVSFIPESKRNIWKIFALYRSLILFISAIIVIVTLLLYPKILSRNSLDDLRSSDGRISVAVMPFQNMTDDKIWSGIQDNIISYLSNFEELRVRNKEAINSLPENKGIPDYASISPSLARAISRKLDVNILIYGDVNQANSVVRVNANLVNSKTKDVFKSFQIDGPWMGDTIFVIFDSLSVLVKNFLVKSKMEKEVTPDLKPYKYTNSPIAFRYLVEAKDALSRYDLTSALNLYYRAVAIDSNYIPAIIFLSMRYEDMGKYKDAKQWCNKAYSKRDKMNKNERIMVDWYHATLYETPNEEIKFLKQYQDADDQVPVSYWQTGNAYLKLFQFNKAIPEFKKALDIYNKWGVKPMMAENYTQLGFAYHQSGQYNKEKKLYRKAMRDFPDNHNIIDRYAILALSEGDTSGANGYIDKYRSALKDLSVSETDIITNVARIYSEADILNKAEECYREALSLEPNNPVRMNYLAYLLIDKDLNLNEGLDLIEKALKLEPDNSRFLHTKGWGLYKQGKSREAFEILQRSWDLKPVYDHRIFLHLQEVKGAVLNMK
jgi:tetratricopeptide (TPR) repeat protein